MGKIHWSLICIITLSCGSSHESPQDIKSIDVDCSAVSNEIEITDYFDIRFIPLETKIESHIRIIERVVLVDSMFLIADKRLDKIYLFNADGKFIRALSSVSKPGPGEFVKVKDIDYHNDTIYLNEYRRILKFDKDLNWVGTKKLKNPVDRILVSDNSIYCYSCNQVFNDHIRLSVMPTHLLSDPFVLMTEYRKLGRIRMNQALNILKTKDDLLLTIFYMDTIYSLQGLKPMPKYIINFDDRTFASEYFNNISLEINPVQVFAELRESKFVHNICNFIDTQEFVFFTFTLDQKRMYFLGMKASGKSILSDFFLLDGNRIGMRLKGLCDGKPYFCLEPEDISGNIRSQNPVFHNGFDEYSNPVIMELSLRNE